MPRVAKRNQGTGASRSPIAPHGHRRTLGDTRSDSVLWAACGPNTSPTTDLILGRPPAYASGSVPVRIHAADAIGRARRRQAVWWAHPAHRQGVPPGVPGAPHATLWNALRFVYGRKAAKRSADRCNQCGRTRSTIAPEGQWDEARVRPTPMPANHHTTLRGGPSPFAADNGTPMAFAQCDRRTHPPCRSPRLPEC